MTAPAPAVAPTSRNEEFYAGAHTVLPAPTSSSSDDGSTLSPSDLIEALAHHASASSDH